ncbi:endoglucanase [Geodermatophilus saharensis]|uniref:Glucanase n=1 Tax=Geodermatophilus saharensis TaxID=1137994 RepID=A0A239I2R4_9ACTN|nr:glycoside hydrolase family 6 protein [Geodermatophilus saharensis]SNS87950.1 endoglucanase [Geodermatophilus saharensis]
MTPAPAPSSSPGRHRAGRVRRRSWAGGLAAAGLAAGLVVPWLTTAGSPPAAEVAAQPALEQARDVRRAPSAPPAPRSPVPTSAAPATTAAPTASRVPPTTAPPTTAQPTATSAADPAGAAGGPAQPGNPLTGMAFHGPNTGAALAAARPGRSAADTAALTELASVPVATWLGAWSGDVTATVRQEVAAARAAGAVPVLVTYNVPGRDCGGYSAGGAGSSAAYLDWVRAVVAGIGTAQAVVVVEPDALAQRCGDTAERTQLLRTAVGLLEANPGTHTYLDAGNPTWVDAATMAGRLRAAGATDADGFALNVSNFETTASNLAYGRQVSSLLGGAHFVVDTSRNGNGPGTDWCNPPGRALGERPTAATGEDRVDAYLWVKRAGESDGTCNGGPPAGTFWDSYAIGLVRGA